MRKNYKLWLLSLLATVAIVSCSFPGIASTSEQLPVVSQEAPTPRLSPIRFPQDEGAHNDLTEWWYYTGHLNATESGGKIHHYGFELVIFQSLRSNLPPAYASHFAISDITRGEFRYEQRSSIMPGPVGAVAPGINVQIGNWSIHGLNGHDRLQADMMNYAMKLDLLGLKPAVLHNGDGLISLGSRGFSYYYSRTRMAISGTIIDHNQPLSVTGLAWMDHQWGNFLPVGISIWDWYSIQLDNSAEIMVSFVRDTSGQRIATYGEYIDANAKNTLINEHSVKTTVLGRWTSPVTGIVYPSRWRLEIANTHVTLTLTPQLKNQELIATQSTGNIYWEGAVDIQGQLAGQVIDGLGYVELTGYR